MSWSKCRFGADQTLINVKTIEKKNVLDPKLGFMKRKQISFWMYWLFQPSGVVNDWWYNLSLNFKKKTFQKTFPRISKVSKLCVTAIKIRYYLKHIFSLHSKMTCLCSRLKVFIFLFFSRFLHNNNLLNNLFLFTKKSVSSWKQWKLIARYILNLSMWNENDIRINRYKYKHKQFRKLWHQCENSIDWYAERI